MWNILIEGSADDDLLKYFFLYRDYFIDMFTDTGLWNEDDICAGYEALAFNLIAQIKVGIQERLGTDTVVGWKQTKKGKTVIIIASKRYVRITYHEDIFHNTRTVVGLEIWRKK